MNGKFYLETELKPAGDQPQAIDKLVAGSLEGKPAQVLLGVTGSGKTFTMAHTIQRLQRPALILAHNKTLAGQLYQEFKSFFPNNAVEYFVSYYDYYQPEAYIARTDTYIEKDLAINDRIEKMRLSATRSLIEREDVIIVASISCIYGLGMPEYYAQMRLTLSVGQTVRRDDVLIHLIELHYRRYDPALSRGTFRVRGDILEVVPAYEDDFAYRVEFFGDEVERIDEIDVIDGSIRKTLDTFSLYPGSHFVTPESARQMALESIRNELKIRVHEFESQGKLVEAQRLRERTIRDLELIKEIGTCKGIENYSRHFSHRQAGDPSPCLLDYFPEDFLIFVDESHQTMPQLHAMYNGDRARKIALIEYGFRLPSAFDNRPLKFEEAYEKFRRVIYVSATPGEWEVREAEGEVIEQIIRPTSLLDPPIVVRPAEGQVEDCLEEIRKETLKGGRVLVTTLTKKLSEDLARYLKEIGVKAEYLHSELDTLERMQVIKSLRLGKVEVLVGINLLREGLDMPEVTLVAVLDADKEGFLRSETSLVQTCGRAARNVQGRVIFYADKETVGMRRAIATTERRRQLQQAYNQAHGIEPRSAARGRIESLEETFGLPELVEEVEAPELEKLVDVEELDEKIRLCKESMQKAAVALRFDEAARWRDQLREYEKLADGEKSL